MRWCLRFTRLLPDNSHRRLLVNYMRKLKDTMQGALKKSLETADVLGDTFSGAKNDPVPLDPGTVPSPAEDNPAPMAVPNVKEPSMLCARPAVCEALVVVAALSNGLLRGCVSLMGFVRRLILSHALNGYTMDAGYALRVSQLRRTRTLEQRQRFWKEQFSRQMLANGELPVEDVYRTFGTVIHILRFVCGTRQGPQTTWPVAMPDVVTGFHPILNQSSGFHFPFLLCISRLQRWFEIPRWDDKTRGSGRAIPNRARLKICDRRGPEGWLIFAGTVPTGTDCTWNHCIGLPKPCSTVAPLWKRNTAATTHC